jgi:hypothetical protein
MEWVLSLTGLSTVVSAIYVLQSGDFHVQDAIRITEVGHITEADWIHHKPNPRFAIFDGGVAAGANVAVS